MASSRSSSYSEKERKRSTKGKGKDKENKLLAFENDLIITTRVKKALKRWKFLQLEISKKQETVNKGGHSKRLEPYKKERDELVEQMKKDIPELQSIFDDECGNAFDRKDKRRTTTGGMIKEKNISENREEHSLRPAEAEINKLTTQLENERKSKDAALFSLQTAEAEINKLTTQLENERKSKDAALFRLQPAEAEINKLTRELENERKSMEDALRRKSEEYRNEVSTLEHRYQEDIKNLEKDKERTKEQEQLQREAARKEMKEKDIVKEECKRLKSKLDEYENENAALKLSHKELIVAQKEEIRKLEERLEAKNKQLTNQLDSERKAKEDALLRLSSMASNKLRDNNPNIADLSDPNRPTKLSEQFSELYDNEWTDAFDELENLLGDKEEKEIISYLRDFVLEIYSICSDITSSKLKTIEEAFAKPSVPSEDIKIPTEIFKTIKDAIKSIAPKLLEHTKESVLGSLEKKYFTDPVAGCLQTQNVKRYIDKCTEVCWYMSVQDPQLVMDGSKSPDEKFDSNKHREYTKKGPYEDFVVWPVLYLYKGGQMLSKGVAQGAKKEMNGQQ